MKAALVGLAMLAVGVVSAPAEIVLSGFGTAGTNAVNAADDLTGDWNGGGTLTVDTLALSNLSNVAGTLNGIYSDLTADGRAPVVIGTDTSEVTLTGALVGPPPGIDEFSISLYDTSGDFNELDYTFRWSSFASDGVNAAVAVGTLTGSSGVFNGTVGSWSLNLFDATGVASTTVSATFSDLGVSTPSPKITSVRSAEATVGQSFYCQITANASPTGYAATGLPDGLSLDPATGIISGTPASAGAFGVGLSASNADGTDTATLSLTVHPASASFYPAIYSAATASAAVGQPFSYQVTATNGPAGFGASGLPPGLGIDAGSGLISGTPTQTGVFSIGLSAANASGAGTAALTLTVGGTMPEDAPVITSAANAAAQVGVAFSYQITASNAPASFAASSLPDGLTLDAASGLLSGAPTAAGTFTVTLSAVNAGGTGTGTLTLAVAHAATPTPAPTPTPTPAPTPTPTPAPTPTPTPTPTPAPAPAATPTPTPIPLTPTPTPTPIPTPPTPTPTPTPPTPTPTPFSTPIPPTPTPAPPTPTPISTPTPTPTPTPTSPTPTPTSPTPTPTSPTPTPTPPTSTPTPTPTPTPVVPTVKVIVAGDGLAVEGGENGKVAFQRTGDLSVALTVRYKIAGTVKAGTDYKSATGTVTIPAGAAETRVKIKPINDQAHGGTRVAKVKLLPSLDGSYRLGTVTVAKIKMIDHD